MGYGWDFGSLRAYQFAFIKGAGLTLALGGLSSLLGTLFGIPLALGLLKSPVVSAPLALLLDAIRAIPNLVLILTVYYLPYGPVFGGQGPSPFAASLIGLSLAQAAYSADLIRSAIHSVPEVQVLSARGLGFREWQIARWVIFPSVVRQVLPSHMALWIGNVKLSSLASTVGVEETVFVARVAMSQTFRSLEAWVCVAAVYISIVTPLTLLERRIDRSAWIRRQ